MAQKNDATGHEHATGRRGDRMCNRMCRGCNKTWTTNSSLVGLHGYGGVEGVKLWSQHCDRRAGGGGGAGAGQGADGSGGAGGEAGAAGSRRCIENTGVPLDNGVPYMTSVGLTLSLASGDESNQWTRSAPSAGPDRSGRRKDKARGGGRGGVHVRKGRRMNVLHT